MNWQNLLQVLPFVVLIGFSLLNWVFRKLREQSELKRIEAERRRRETEALRTGRGEAVSSELEPARATPDDAERRRKLEELAARRRAQLEELRRRQMQRRTQQPQGGQGAGGPSGGGTGSRSGSQASPAQRTPTRTAPRATPGSNVRVPGGGGRGSGGSMPQGFPVPTSRGQRGVTNDIAETQRRRVAARQLQKQAEGRAEFARQATEEADVRARASKPVSVAAPAAPVAALPDLRASLGSPHALRNAIVAAEILGPPVAMRKPGEGPFDRAGL